MDYEQKYNEALEKARKLYNDAKANEYESDMEDYESIFPELAESEDERIRKALIWHLKAGEDFVSNGVTKAECLAYLEKQAEQKQGKIPPYVTGFKGDPDPAGTSDLEEAAKEYASKTLCDPDDGPSTGLAKESFIAGAEWQKEQKPAEWQKEQKPAEWSEEDEKIITALTKALIGSDSAEKIMLFDVVTIEMVSNWLKSLRPSWKPSEEHLSALLAVFNDPNNIGSQTCQLALTDLYEQLKKL